MDNIYNIFNEHRNVLPRAEIVVKKFKYFSPSNTTEYLGFKNLWFTVSQIYNNVEIYSQDMPTYNFEKSVEYAKTKYNNISDYFDESLSYVLMEPESRNNVIF